MEYIVRKLPYCGVDRWVDVPDGSRFLIKADQVVVWVSLAQIASCPLRTGPRRFPALLDTGHGHNFLIKEEHVRAWAGLDPGTLDKLGELMINGIKTPSHRVDLWVHRNRFGESDTIDDSPPSCLELDNGISISPIGTNYPRIPLLGMRVARLNRHLICVDSKNLRVSISRIVQ
jgi:hypothetical protein